MHLDPESVHIIYEIQGSYTEPDQLQALRIICDPPQENVPNGFLFASQAVYDPFKRKKKRLNELQFRLNDF